MHRLAAAALAALAVLAIPGTSSAGPIQHVVVVFNENVSFDHYFGTYPNATNPPDEPAFTPAVGTPQVNGLQQPVDLITTNPNSAKPKRLDRSQPITCDQDHGYADEQKAFDDNLMDKFVEFTSGGGCSDKSIVMNYYDGNTVTALWNLAQHFTMSDAFRATTFGPSTPGALNLVAGTTHGASITYGSV